MDSKQNLKNFQQQILNLSEAYSFTRLSTNDSAKTITAQNVNKQNSTRLRSCQHLPVGLRPRSLPAISCSRYSNLLDILLLCSLLAVSALSTPPPSSCLLSYTLTLRFESSSSQLCIFISWMLSHLPFSILKDQTVIGKILWSCFTGLNLTHCAVNFLLYEFLF